MAENIQSNVPGTPATVSSAADATGGIDSGHFIDAAIDEELFRFNSDDTPLMNLMLRAKRVKVDSPEVDHFMIDEPVSSFRTIEDVEGEVKMSAPLPLEAQYQNVARPHTTLLVPEVPGYAPDGKTKIGGQPLMLFVSGTDSVTGNPVVRAVNGLKDNPSSDFSLLPAIPKGSLVVVLANSLYETQKEVDPDLIVPHPSRVYLQKRGMNQVVSDYFDAQKKRIPFSKAVIAEQAIANFKVRGNRTLWAGRAGKFKVSIPKMGLQNVYCTEGVRWQFKRELIESGQWSVEKVIALAKMFFAGEDVPKTALLLAGKDLLANLQCIDYKDHPEVHITTKVNSVGWTVTNFHTVFGDIEIKREPTLDRLGWSNSGALIGEDRLVHYVYSSEHSFVDRVEGEEATRSGILIWDALALKGSCHIWIDGDSNSNENPDTRRIVMWDSADAPAVEQKETNLQYNLLRDCPGISPKAYKGQIWEYIPISDDRYGWVKVK